MIRNINEIYQNIEKSIKLSIIYYLYKYKINFSSIKIINQY